MLSLGDFPASEFYMPTFRNTLFHLHRQVRACRMNSTEDMFGVLYGERFDLEMASAIGSGHFQVKPFPV